MREISNWQIELTHHYQLLFSVANPTLARRSGFLPLFPPPHPLPVFFYALHFLNLRLPAEKPIVALLDRSSPVYV